MPFYTCSLEWREIRILKNLSASIETAYFQTFWGVHLPTKQRSLKEPFLITSMNAAENCGDI